MATDRNGNTIGLGDVYALAGRVGQISGDRVALVLGDKGQQVVHCQDDHLVLADEALALPGIGDVIVLRDTSSQNVDAASAHNVTWDTEDEKDGSFTHSTSTNTEEILVDATGTYEFGCFLHLDGTGAPRWNGILSFDIFDGDSIWTPASYKSCPGYIRQQDNQDETTLCLVVPLKLTTGQGIRWHVTRESITTATSVVLLSSGYCYGRRVA